jgi:hypothetical protein
VEQIAWTFALSGFAGLVAYLQRFAGDQRPAWEWRVAAVKVVTGSFVGLLTLWLIGKRIEDQGYVNFAIAIAGYGGPVTLDFFLQVFRDAISRAAQNQKDQGPKV